MHKNKLLAAVSALSVVGCWSTGATAQSSAVQPADQAEADTPDYGVEDIVVTARKQSEDIQDVPLSVSAVSGTTLERRGLQNVKDLAQSVPSLSLIGAIGAALTLGARRGGVLLSLLVLPLYVPVLILGAAAVEGAVSGLGAAPDLLVLAAIALAALPMTALAGAAAIRLALE